MIHFEPETVTDEFERGIEEIEIDTPERASEEVKEDCKISSKSKSQYSKDQEE